MCAFGELPAGRHNVAEAFSSAYTVFFAILRGYPDDASDSLTVFRLRIKEASLLESKGNFTGVIRLSL
jgi:tryptophan synthase beta subunit